MKVSGLIVEYNPLHNGHLHHINKAKKIAEADCIIAVMSGSFLQRGEPAIIDKFHRAQAALTSGVDIVLELPYAYAVQSSHLFSKGSVGTLNNIGVSSICFGSESGKADDFIKSYEILTEKEHLYKDTLQSHLNQGESFPYASKKAYKKIGLTTNGLDLSEPNNILGFSYVKTILDKKLPIVPLTIKRTNSNYHEQSITSSISSATSIRKEILTEQTISQTSSNTMPQVTIEQLKSYKEKTSIWHTLENYFPYVHYQVMTMTNKELAYIHGIDEGLEYRIKRLAKEATSFQDWINKVKTKRYTWSRLQRTFIHILTNTKKEDIEMVKNSSTVPHIRILGLTETGRTYLNRYKKDIPVPIVSQLGRNPSPLLTIDERASNAYYSVLPPKMRQQLLKQELRQPILVP